MANKHKTTTNKEVKVLEKNFSLIKACLVSKYFNCCLVSDVANQLCPSFNYSLCYM